MVGIGKQLMASISVIIPIYEITDYLKQAVDSILLQQYPSVEIILVDDGSSPQAAARIDAIAKDTGITVLHQENTGPAIARRNGVRIARGEYILFLDADDFLLPGSIAHLTGTLQQHPNAIAAYGRKTFISDTGGFGDKQVSPSPHNVVSGNTLPSLLKGIPLLSNGNVCIRKSALADSMFPEKLHIGEDWVTWCHLALKGAIAYAGDRVVLCIRQHLRNLSQQALADTSLLFGMLPVVFDDPVFKERVGEMPLAVYRSLHMQNIQSYIYQHGPRGKTSRQLRKVLATPSVAKTRKIRVLHVVKYFHAGGAERLLTGLLKYSDPSKYEHIVLSLSVQNERLRHIEETLNVPYRAIDTDGLNYRIRRWQLCFSFIKAAQPDVIKSWLPPANIFAGIAGKMMDIPVIWGIHDAENPKNKSVQTRRQLFFSKRLPDHIICCSQKVYDTCKQAGFPERLLQIIPNGIDSKQFVHQPEGRKRVRTKLKADDHTLLIGMAAEYSTVKRPDYFLQAAAIFVQEKPNTRFVLCGRNMTGENEALVNTIAKLGLKNVMHLLGIHNDMADIYSALDIHTLTSHTESFGLAVLEAAACKTLNVATDTGIIGELLQDVGFVIPVTEGINVLTAAWQKAASLGAKEKARRLEEGRQRALAYSISETALTYDALYAEFARK